jgi:hypothetical protein
LASPDEVAIPDIPIPEWEVATPRSAATSESPLPEPSAASPESPPVLPPQLPPEWPESAEPSGVTLAKATPPQPEPGLSPEREAPPPLPEVNLSPIAANPDPALRYVVVGSWYFWSVVALALLLALGVAFWSMTRNSAPSLTGEAVPQSPDAALDRALADAQQAEQELRLQLEQRLVALAGQRGRCS